MDDAQPLPKRPKHSHLEHPHPTSAAAAADGEQAAVEKNAATAAANNESRACIVKTFTIGGDEPASQIRVQIPERSSSDLGSFLWPSSLLLSDFIHHNMRDQLQGKTVLELGAGRCLSGIHCALLGCSRVLLSDAVPSVLREAEQIVALNGLTADRAHVHHLCWGEFTPLTRDLRGQVDFIIGADVFYDGRDFEDVFATISYFGVPFLTAYQHRGEGRRRFRALCRKWRMDMRRVEWSFDPELLRHEQRSLRSIDEGVCAATAGSSSSSNSAAMDSSSSADAADHQPYSSSLHENVALELLLFTPQGPAPAPTATHS